MQINILEEMWNSQRGRLRWEIVRAVSVVRRDFKIQMIGVEINSECRRASFYISSPTIEVQAKHLTYATV